MSITILASASRHTRLLGALLTALLILAIGGEPAAAAPPAWSARVTGAASPTISVTPTSAPPGAQVSVLGSGFTPRRAGTLTVNRSTPISIRTDVRGTFSATITVPAVTATNVVVSVRVQRSAADTTLTIEQQTASPARQPAPAPASMVYDIPGTIKADCSVDVTEAINAWLRALPNGTAAKATTARFAKDACYRVDHTIGTHYTWDNKEIAGLRRTNLILDGNGATIDGSINVPTPYANRAGISLIDSSHIIIENFTIRGSHPNPCRLERADGGCRPGGYMPDFEWQHGVGIFGGDHVTVRNNRVYNARGDGVTMSQGWSPTTQRTTNSLIENNLIDGAGRMGVALTTNDNIIVRGNVFDRISYHVIDLEPEVHAVTNILVEGNTVRRHYLTFIAAASGVCTPRTNYTVRDNVMEMSGVTSWPALIFESTQYSAGDCRAAASDLVITGNTLPATQNNLDAVHVRGFRNVIINDNLAPLDAPFSDRAMVSLSDVSGTLEVMRNRAPGVPGAYMINGVVHGPGVNACGNSTGSGDNIPRSCP